MLERVKVRARSIASVVVHIDIVVDSSELANVAEGRVGPSRRAVSTDTWKWIRSDAVLLLNLQPEIDVAAAASSSSATAATASLSARKSIAAASLLLLLLCACERMIEAYVDVVCVVRRSGRVVKVLKGSRQIGFGNESQ